MESESSLRRQLWISRFQRAKSELRNKNETDWATAAEDVQIRLAASEYFWPWTYETVARFLTLQDAAYSLSTYPSSDDMLCDVCQYIDCAAMLSVDGCMHHQNGTNLINSASYCRLCALILSSLKVNHNEWEEILTGSDQPIYLFLVGSTLTVRYKEKVTYKNTERYFIASRYLQICCPSSKGAPPTDPSKALTIEFIGGSLANCFDSHTECSGKLEVPLPSRLIDVGSSIDGQPNPCLWLNTGELTRGVYTALSYCWGRDTTLVLTPSNASLLQSGVPTNELPQTLKDAIEITRGLGIRFLWVDALCILQGDSEEAKHDWSQQSVQMDAIFSQAAVVLGAASAAASDEGIMHQPNQFKDFVDAPHQVAGLLDYGNDPIYIGTFSLPGPDRPGPLYTRGWTFQERLLASRYVHIGERSVFFECDHERKFAQGDDNDFKHALCNRIAASPTFNEWHQLVEEYSGRILTRSSDNLIGVSGVGKIFHTRLKHQSQYLAGLWSGNLACDLLWYASSPAPRLDIAPSWSWASRKSEISYQGIKFHACSSACAKTIGFNVEGSPNEFGHRTWGHVMIRGYLRRIFVRGGEGRFHLTGFSASRNQPRTCDHDARQLDQTCCQDQIHRVGRCVVDSPSGEEDMVSVTSHFSFFGGTGWKDLYLVWSLELHPGRGILLKPKDQSTNEFERVGYYEYSERRGFHDQRSREERGADRDPLSQAAYFLEHPFKWMEAAVEAGDDELISEWYGDNDAVVRLV